MNMKKRFNPGDLVRLKFLSSEHVIALVVSHNQLDGSKQYKGSIIYDVLYNVDGRSVLQRYYESFVTSIEEYQNERQ